MIVANQVFNTWRIREEMQGAKSSAKALKSLRKTQQDILTNRLRMLERLKEQSSTKSSNDKKDSKGSTSNNAVKSGGDQDFRAQDLRETEAKIQALEARNATTAVQAKIQLQSQIVAFVLQRRFHHAQLLAGFYNLIFIGSQQKLEVGKGELSSFISDADITFTVDSLLSVSQETINDVRTGVDAVLAADSEGRRIVALERLQETFFLGEHLLELDRISSEQRRRFLDLFRAMLTAQQLANVKDFAKIKDIIAQLEILAPDFPADQMNASVEAAMSASSMAVFAARQYGGVGNIDAVKEEMTKAAQIWPLNPAIKEFQTDAIQQTSSIARGVQVFDDLFKRGDRRGIYANRIELGFALANDEERRKKFMDVVDLLSRIDLFVAQSEEMANQGDYFAAWELIELAYQLDNNDAQMNRMRANLAPRVAKFVGLLDRAEDAESSNRYSTALNNYLIAQDIYPASRLCRLGIDRVSQSVLNIAADHIKATQL